MAVELLKETYEPAALPAGVSAGEVNVLRAIAWRAWAESRTCRLSYDDLAALACMKASGVKSALQRLAERGLECRVPIGTVSTGPKAGAPLFAARGHAVAFRLPHLGNAGAGASPSDAGKPGLSHSEAEADTPPMTGKPGLSHRNAGATAPPPKTDNTSNYKTERGTAAAESASVAVVPAKQRPLFPAVVPEPADDHAAAVTAAREAWEAANGTRLAGRDRTVHETAVQRLLVAGNDPTAVVAAARLAGVNGWPDPSIELRKRRKLTNSEQHQLMKHPELMADSPPAVPMDVVAAARPSPEPHAEVVDAEVVSAERKRPTVPPCPPGCDRGQIEQPDGAIRICPSCRQRRQLGIPA